MVSNRKAQVAVVYLAYLPYGSEPIEQFFASYARHPAGLDHKLLVALKGNPQAEVPPVVEASVWVPNDCLDLGSYLFVARKYAAQRYLFLNTSTELLADGWLEKLDRHLTKGVGIVGATGSHGGSVDGGVRAPNPHVRTNGFMLERDLMLTLDWQEPIVDKRDAYAVEHGPRSITTQVRERGLEAVLVGRDGEGYPVERWQESKTFWCAEQENLLIEDNATRRWYRVHRGRRKTLQRFAWPAWS